MATPSQISQLRRLINEPLDAEPYTDEVLGLLIDEAQGAVRVAAGQVWTQKAATASSLVDIQEGNSNRKLSQLQSAALRMAESLGADQATGRKSRTRRIERG